ncbi:hypothetical protein, partial [Thiorhodococcus minor]|uniref:hypothetical protein n=1 Tax=Thiorhodococcus minor TaxID=57489 RepID=UPI001ADD0F58
GRLDRRSRMSGDVHVRFCERLGGRFPGATRLSIDELSVSDALSLFQTFIEVNPVFFSLLQGENSESSSPN